MTGFNCRFEKLVVILFDGWLIFEERLVLLFGVEEGIKGFDSVDVVRSSCDELSSDRDSSELKREESLVGYLIGFGLTQKRA